ncbi:hypothetical protein PIB30_078903 [Stylosanthes scabra]|uniref:Uncharacterized protein n=1 Tax=Stylosanthes scabra TaxID=79078 RepID=A0ABU6VS13_9FABA|nr:hypothetical protein [Stylosanthes scabra]
MEVLDRSVESPTHMRRVVRICVGVRICLQRKVEKLRVANGLDGKRVKMATHMRRDRRICVGGGGNVMDMEVDRGVLDVWKGVGATHMRRMLRIYVGGNLSVRVDRLGRMGGKGCWGYGWHAYAWTARICVGSQSLFNKVLVLLCCPSMPKLVLSHSNYLQKIICTLLGLPIQKVHSSISIAM